MSSWRECKVEEVCFLIVDCVNKTAPKVDYETPYKMIRTTNVRNGKIDTVNVNYVTQETYEKWVRREKPRFNDIILTREAPVGEVGIIKSTENFFLGQRTMMYRANESIMTQNFLYYSLLSPFLQEQIHGLSMGSVVGHIRVPDAKKFIVKVPPLEEQKAIAEVLSSLDDKIDLLHRQNHTLESLAQTLFRQWFIEEAKEEWEEKPLSFFGDIICGKTPSKSNPQYFDGNIPFIKIPDMHGNTFIFRTTDTLSEIGKESQKNKTLPPKSICVSCIATVGLVSMNIIESQTNQQINSIVPNKDIYRYFLYLFMKSSYELLHAMASGGTATLNLNTGDFSKMEILKPDDETLQKFHEIIESTFEKIFINSKQIQTLENLRDTLLPKLLSGEVSLK